MLKMFKKNEGLSNYLLLKVPNMPHSPRVNYVTMCCN